MMQCDRVPCRSSFERSWEGAVASVLLFDIRWNAFRTLTFFGVRLSAHFAEMRAILSFAILTCLAAGHAVRETYVLHEKRDGTLPSSLTKRNKLDGSTTLPMRIGLTQNNLHKAHDWLNDVSHPTSLNYGHHWTQQEVIEAFKPSDESFNSVMNWLTSSGISAKRITHSDNKQWLAFDATVVEAESLLHADYHEYEHRSGTSMIGCDEYHVPKRVSKHVDYITPGVKRSQMRKRGFGV